MSSSPEKDTHAYHAILIHHHANAAASSLGRCTDPKPMMVMSAGKVRNFHSAMSNAPIIPTHRSIEHVTITFKLRPPSILPLIDIDRKNTATQTAKIENATAIAKESQ